jgi:hypothetical protein
MMQNAEKYAYTNNMRYKAVCHHTTTLTSHTVCTTINSLVLFLSDGLNEFCTGVKLGLSY